jgi:acetylornithine deacetylase/succinyl-diaminopimelate desuccinylase-like protein
MVKNYITSNKDRFLSELFDWLRIPSISADSRHKPDVRKAAEYLKEKFAAAGVSMVE